MNNSEESRNPAVKILLRGDLLGALNCLFPELDLIPSESNPKIPILDADFSLFSESPQYLEKVFSSAKDYRKKIAIDVENSETNDHQQPALEQAQNFSEILPTEKFESDPIDTSPNTSDTQIGALFSSEPNFSDLKSQNSDQFLSCALAVDAIDTAALFLSSSDEFAIGKPSPLALVDLDQEYVNFVIQLLEEDYEDKIFEEKLEVEAKNSKIGPFNSDLPVLNISKCNLPLTISKNSCPTLHCDPIPPSPSKKKSYSSVLKYSPRKLDQKMIGKFSHDFTSNDKLHVKSRRRGKHTEKAHANCRKLKVFTNTENKTDAAAGKKLKSTNGEGTAQKNSPPINKVFARNSSSSNKDVNVSEQNLEKNPSANSSKKEYCATNTIFLNETHSLHPSTSCEDTSKVLTILHQKCSEPNMWSHFTTFTNDFGCGDETVKQCKSNTQIHEETSDGQKDIPIRAYVSVSELEKEAMEQYRNSDESIEEKYKMLEKEAEEQYNSGC